MTDETPVPGDVAAAYDEIPEAARACLLSARALIFEAARDAGVGALTETLKWGQPSYLTEASKAVGEITLYVGDDKLHFM